MQLTLASYNVENMFDVFDDPYTADEISPVKPRGQIETIARLIRAMDADVIALTEIENEGVLRAAVHDFLGDLGYDYVAVCPTNDMRGINLGVISRVPIRSLTSHRLLEFSPDGREDEVYRFARDLLKVELQVLPERTLSLYVVHFKSKRDSANDPQSARWRLAEAQAAAAIIRARLAADPAAWIALAGDFNDTPDTRTVGTFIRGSRDQPPLLRDVHSRLLSSERITYLREPYRSTIDYILVSPALEACLVQNSPRVFSDEEALLAGSDHAPLLASFRLAVAEAAAPTPDGDPASESSPAAAR